VIELLVAYGPLIQVIAIIVGFLVVASILIWFVIGGVLWFVRGTHDTQAETVESEWFDEK